MVWFKRLSLKCLASGSTMHLKSLTLDRFRGAKQLTLDLDPRLNIFYGRNGAGKSTILDAAAIMLSWLVNRIKHAGASGRPIDPNDIHNGASMTKLVLGLVDRQREFSWRLVKTRKGHTATESSTLAPVSELARDTQERLTRENGRLDLPLFVYYPVNRAVQKIPLRIRTRHSFDLLSAYDDALTSAAEFKTFFEWFREREDLENEYRRYLDQAIKPEGFQFPDIQLETVRRALQAFMPEFTNLTVRRQPLRMEVEKQGKKLIVNQLSDGEKCLMAMVGDLARRMAIANPTRPDPLQGQGIVMIDEVDLHLHPQWQRMVIPKLLDVFPNCQFLISTHSPHVINHAQAEHVFHLQMRNHALVCEHPAEAYGKSIDRTLEDLMETTTRPDKVQERLQELFQLIDRRDLAGASELQDTLRSDIGEDPDLVKAGVLIKRMALIGK